MNRKASRTSWTSRGFGETCERWRSVTVIKPWTEGECTVCAGVRKD